MIRISIITPTFNSEDSVIRNSQSIIKQTCKDYEHIVIDNLSKDNTIRLIKNIYEESGLSYRLKIISEKDSGISDAFNKGITAAEGDIIGILNSDDYFYNEYVLEKVLNEFLSEKTLFVHGNIFFDDRVYGSNIRKPLLCPITEAMPFNHPTMFFRKSVYIEHGLFDASYKYAMDFEFICRLEKQIKDFREKGFYIDGKPLIVMNAGGASWRHEINSINEVKRALKQHDFWNLNAMENYFLRLFRTWLKQIFNFLNINSPVKIWRNKKWKN
jgi:glycosyltransferase involved in cell wall biosynthesis